MFTEGKLHILSGVQAEWMESSRGKTQLPLLPFFPGIHSVQNSKVYSIGLQQQKT